MFNLCPKLCPNFVLPLPNALPGPALTSFLGFVRSIYQSLSRSMPIQVYVYPGLCLSKSMPIQVYVYPSLCLSKSMPVQVCALLSAPLSVSFIVHSIYRPVSRLPYIRLRPLSVSAFVQTALPSPCLGFRKTLPHGVHKICQRSQGIV